MIPAWHNCTLIWTCVFLNSSVQCLGLFLVKALNVVHLMIKLCVWLWSTCDSESFKKQKNKSKAWVFDMALWGAHHISISLLADVDGGVSDCGQPLCLALCSKPWGKEGLHAPYSPPKPNHKLPHVWCLPITLLTSEADPRPAGRSLKPHTFTTQPPPMAATFLPLTYHPKHYHKLLPVCQTTHTAELTVRLCIARPCKDSSVLQLKVELVERGKCSWLWCAFYTRHKTYCGFLCFVACGDAVAMPVEQTPAHWNNYCAVFEADEKCVRQCVNCFETCHKSACFMSFTHLTNHAVSHCLSPTKIEESIEVWLRRPHTRCYSNDGLSLFVCTSEEQAQIINECFASSVQPQLSQWVNKVGQTNHCVCLCVLKSERDCVYRFKRVLEK